MANWKDSVLHWKRKLEKGVPDEKILDILHKLHRVPITVELLQETKIGLVVSGLKKLDGDIGSKAGQLVLQWKQIVYGNDKPGVTPPKYTNTNNGQYKSSHNADNKYLSKDSTSSQKSKTQKYTTNIDDSYDPSSSKDDYRDFKKGELVTYDPSSTQQDYRKFLQSYQDSESPDANGDSPENNYVSSSKYLSQVGREEVESPYSEKISKHSRKDVDSDLDTTKNHSSQSSSKKHSNSHKDKSLKLVPHNKHNSGNHTETEKPRSHSSSRNSNEQDKKHKSAKPDHKPSKRESESKGIDRTKSDKQSGSKKKDLKLVNSTDAFNSSIASFEACLGLNDSVIPVMKTKTKNTSAKPSNNNATKSSPEKQKSSEPSSSHQEKRSSKHESSKAKSSHKSSSKRKSEKTPDGVPDALKKPKLKPLDQVDVLSTLPEIQPEYTPLRLRMPDSPPPKKKASMSNEEAIQYTSSRKDRTAVYAGRRNNFYSEVPSLYDCCVRVLSENIDDLGFTGGVPYDLLKPILEKCTPVQLYTFEDYNQYLLEDTNELWEIHLKRDFKSKIPDEDETWRDLYLRLYDEREAKLKMVTANISKSMLKAVPVRQTKLAYVDSVAKPPRAIARKQARFGTGLPVAHPVKAGPPSQATPRPTAPAINAANAMSSSSSSSLGQSSSQSAKKIFRVAPLMQKTLKFMKQNFRR